MKWVLVHFAWPGFHRQPAPLHYLYAEPFEINVNIQLPLNHQDIKNNAWVTVNNDFLSRVRRFGNDFHEWRSHEWKSLPNRLTSDKKSLFTVTNVLFYFLHAILCHEHTNPLRTIIECSFRHCCQGRPFQTEHSDITTIDLSCEREILVLWRHICLLSLHA